MIQVTPINPSFVADVSGIDLRHLSEYGFTQIYQAWLDFGVLRLRNQPLNEDELQTFSARFGPLEDAPMGRLPEAARKKMKNRYVSQQRRFVVNVLNGFSDQAAEHKCGTIVNRDDILVTDRFK